MRPFTTRDVPRSSYLTPRKSTGILLPDPVLFGTLLAVIVYTNTELETVNRDPPQGLIVSATLSISLMVPDVSPYMRRG